MGIHPGEVLIDDSNYLQFTDPDANGNNSFGLVARDFRATPVASEPYTVAFPFPTIPRSEWDARIEEQAALKSRLSDIRDAGNGGQPIPSLNQNPWGFCWAHSTTHSAMLVRAKNNQPYSPLSAFAIASIVKGYRDEGGFCQQSLAFAANVGIPSQKVWPQGKVERSLDTPAMRADAARHKAERWIDLNPRNFDQLATLLLLGIPAAIDVMWWGHSICAMDLVRVESGAYGVRIWNSWGNEWGANGTAVLSESKGTPDGSIAPYVLNASAS